MSDKDKLAMIHAIFNEYGDDEKEEIIKRIRQVLYGVPPVEFDDEKEKLDGQS